MKEQFPEYPEYEYCGVKIDLGRDSLLGEQALRYLTTEGFYKKPNETTPQETLARGQACYSFGDLELAQRIYDQASKQWFTFASPVLSNALPIEWEAYDKSEFQDAQEWLRNNVTPEGMPISCFLNQIHDSKEGLTVNSQETKELSMAGGGVGTYMGNRSPDSKSTGVMAHAKEYDAVTLAYKQAESRRGSIALYMDIDHPEIISFLGMRDPTGGDMNKKCFNLNHGLNITDKFMRAVISGSEYPLIDPKHGNTGQTLNAREVWEKILETRKETGEPYLLFVDTVNANIPKWVTKPTYNVKQSNLCSEITLFTSPKRSAVCCLSSLNLEKYEEWKDTTLVQDLVRFLDNVLEYFIQLAPPSISRAIHSAKKERAIGLGTLGFFSFLQSKMIAPESDEARQINIEVFENIKVKAIEESLQLGEERGEAMDCMGTGMRNSHLMAIAPNASSSAMAGTSPSIEPWKANVFLSEGRAGSILIKNKFLEQYLESVGKNNKKTWDSVLNHDGSIQHLDFIPQEIKDVFKTANELNQMKLVNLVQDRTPFICQSQSFNVFVNNGMSADEISDIHMMGWAKGVKSFYYCRSDGTMKADIGSGKEKPLNAITTPAPEQESNSELEMPCCEG